MRHGRLTIAAVAFGFAAAMGALASVVGAERAAAQNAEALQQQGYAIGDVVLGSEDAPITVIEYASLTCPHCAAFHNDSFGEIKERYVDTGKVRWIVREVYRFQVGLMASALTRCGGEEAFYPMVDIFLGEQADWLQGDEQEILQNIRERGLRGGLTEAQVEACMSDETLHTQLIEDFQRNVGEHQVQATPTFIVNGEVVRGNRSAAQLGAIIDGHLPSN